MKRLTIILACVLLPSLLFAQTAAATLSTTKIDLGIKLGVNMDKLSGNSWDNGYKAGFLGGAYLGVRASRIGVQVEAFYSQSNYTVSGHNFYDLYSAFYQNVADSAKKGSFKVSYMNIPVLFEIKLMPYVWLQVGPQYSAVLSVSDGDNMLTDAKKVFKSGTVSGVVGVDIKLPFHLDLGARYILGFSDVNNTNASDSWNNRTLQVHLGYRLL